LVNIQDWKANRIKSLAKKYPEVEKKSEEKKPAVKQKTETNLVDDKNITKEIEQPEIVDIKSIDDLKAALADKKIVKV
jgi:hypothetical protein